MTTLARALGSLLLVAATCAGCGQGAEVRPAGEGRPVQVGVPGPVGPEVPTPPRAWPPGVPARGACAADADCVVVVDAPQSDPCCDVTVTAEPIARRFQEWVTAFRARECRGVRCPPQQLPGAQLAPCGYEGRCVSGQCRNACGLPPAAPAPGLGVPSGVGGGS